jgi:PAS domain S-box-containing protein
MVPEDIAQKYLAPGELENLPFNPEDIDPKVDWQSHLEVLPLATWTCTTDGKDVFVNRACRRLLGITSTKEILAGKWTSNIHRSDRDSFLKSWQRFLRSSTARFRAQVKWVRPNTGQTITLAVRVQRTNANRYQGWLKEAVAELALTKLEEIAYDFR